MIYDVNKFSEIEWGIILPGDTLNLVSSRYDSTLYVQCSNILISGWRESYDPAVVDVTGNNLRYGVYVAPEYVGVKTQYVHAIGALNSGIQADGEILNCKASSCGIGISLYGGLVDGCETFNNTNGIVMSVSGSKARNNSAHHNSEDGIRAGVWNMPSWLDFDVSNNSCDDNGLSGVNAHYLCNAPMIADNVCRRNGQVGIHVGGSKDKGSTRHAVIANNRIYDTRKLRADGAGVLIDDATTDCISASNYIEGSEECGVKFNNCSRAKSINDVICGSQKYKHSNDTDTVIV